MRDHGVGIADHDRGRVFERFYRGRGAMKDQVKGAGLGLSLVARIVEDHGGSVGLESREGEGSTFTIYLPAEK